VLKTQTGNTYDIDIKLNSLFHCIFSISAHIIGCSLCIRSENLKGREHMEDLGVNRKIILQWILGEKGGKMWTGFIWLQTGTNGGSYSNESYVPIKGGEFLD
jgi:hypothetical protein